MPATQSTSIACASASRPCASITCANPAIVFSVLAETLRLQAPQIYMMSLGLLLILSVLYLPGGLASLRFDTWKIWRDDIRSWWRLRRYEWSGDKAKDKARARRAREVNW